MRLALLLALVLCTAAALPAQSPDALGGTWYTSERARVILRAGSDSTATDLAVTSLVTLELQVEGTTVTGQERRELSIPAEETANRKDPVTVTTVREVTGTLEGDTLHLTMTAQYGPALHYEGALSPNGRHLTLRLVSQTAVRGAAPPVPTDVAPLTFGRQPPKPEPRKG
ncbi:MAG TPA: hypothetical protein VK002_03140 [Rubricoccaceae bacterium]|jgi:hypothetical protein|nr:hypothetical protein [Rubricoccaceae bacterium]